VTAKAGDVEDNAIIDVQSHVFHLELNGDAIDAHLDCRWKSEQHGTTRDSSPQGHPAILVKRE
jgi:hypothetical protein